MSKRVCVIGVGRWGAKHAATLKELGCLAGVVDHDAAALKKARAAHPAAAAYESVDEALAAGFDAFIVATPAQTHFEIARRILEGRFHALVEKPLAMTAAEARSLCDLADAQGVNLMVGHVLLFHPAIRRIRELMMEGKTGRLQYLYSNRLNLGTVRTEENILWSFAPHDISIFHHLIGVPPIEVISRGGAFLQPHIHDSTLTVLKYPGNVSGHVFVSWLHPFKEHRLVVIGTKGMLVFDDASADKHLVFYEKGIDWVQGEPIPREGPTEVIEYAREEPLANELRYFIDRLGRGRPELADGRSAVEVLEILEDATGSLLAGMEIRPRRHGSSGSFIHPSSFVDEDVEIGSGTRVWHFSHIQSGARIGANCTIGQNVNIGNNVRVGSHVKIQNNVSVYEGVELEDYVFCGPSATFTNVLDPRSKYPQKGSHHYRRTLVRRGATIGAHATILCGHTIGRHAFVAAGAVVTGDVQDYALVVGVPARRKGWMCECGGRLPNRGAPLACPRCGMGYETTKEGVSPASTSTRSRRSGGKAAARQGGRVQKR